MHRGVRLKKVTTKRTQTPPSVAASTLAQAFNAICQPFLIYTDYLYIGYICIYKLIFIAAANRCIGKSQTSRCRCPPVQPIKEEGHQEYQGRNKAPESGYSSSSSPDVSYFGGIFSLPSRCRDPASTISPSSAGSTRSRQTPAGRTPSRRCADRRGRSNYRSSRFSHTIGSFFNSNNYHPPSG